jgi:LmbE family N-acetylglucosaminyl deacetylase
MLGVWAHPDDETYLSAGLMARVARASGRAVCVHATAGERGTDDPNRWPPDMLGPRRSVELRAALGVLDVHESEILGYPDGGCERMDDRVAVAALEDLIRRVRPDVIVTFGPDGITGHPDHVTISRWATAAWARTRSATLLYATLTESFVTRFREVHRRLGLHGDESVWIPDSDVDLAIRLDDDELDTKREALAAHASQTVDLAAAIGEETYRVWHGVESFRLPTPAEVDFATATAGVA